MRRFDDLVKRYAQTSPEQLPALLQQRLAAEPRCPVAHYLLGCQCLDRGRPAQGVRHLMLAYHAEPRLQSAALLVFAGLNWISRRGTPLLPVLVETWEEFRRPDFDRFPYERRLLDALAEPDPGLERVGVLAGRLWRLPVRTLRAELRQLLLTQDAESYRLLLAAG
jgi:hypothetical protein